MAFMSQEHKKELAPAIKAVLKKYGVKGTIGVRHHSTLVVNIKSGDIDFMKFAPDDTYIQVNPYHIASQYTGAAKKFLLELKAAMDEGNYDKSDAQIDYFCVGWYVDINIGQWDKPYVYTGLDITEEVACDPTNNVYG